MAKKSKTSTTNSSTGNTSNPPQTSEVPSTPSMPSSSDMGWGHDMPWGMHHATLEATIGASIVKQNGHEVTGEDILAIAKQHLGESYVLGARAPMANSEWRGPWDCAEFVSWCLYQASGILFGTEPRNDPVRADAYTGYWAQQALATQCTVSVATANVTMGAILLRYPAVGAIGHIVFSDGLGGTIEAHSSKDGVIAGVVDGRRWDTGILVPGIRYHRSVDDVLPNTTARTIRLTSPLIKSEIVAKIQRCLVKLGYAPGSNDGIYGPQTAHAVAKFQADRGLVADGEVGSNTLKALDL